MKITKTGPLNLPEFWRGSGVLNDGTNPPIYQSPEAKTWKGVPVVSTKREVPIAYLANALAWQDQGQDPADYTNLLIYGTTRRSPIRVPRTVVLRNFNSSVINDGLLAVADTLRQNSILVVNDPFNQVVTPGFYPALPITEFEMVDPGNGAESVSVAKLKPEEFVGGEILEIIHSSERDSFGLYYTSVTGSSTVGEFPGYREVYPTLSLAQRAIRTISVVHSNNATGTGNQFHENWSATIVLETNPTPPPSSIITVQGSVHTIAPITRYPVIHTTSSSTTISFEWTELKNRCKEFLLTWIDRCAKYNAHILYETDLEYQDPFIVFSDTDIQKTDIELIDGMNPANRAAVVGLISAVGSANMSMEDVTTGVDFETTCLDKIKSKISSFFGITL